MKLGLDFDNTIACYDGAFHASALKRGLISADLPRTKRSVRDTLRGAGKADDWALIQGRVYGARMDLAVPYPGSRAFMKAAAAAGIELFIVSHKTKAPYAGPRYDLHAAAWEWLEARGILDVIPRTRVHFELTKEAKLARITAIGCNAFVDDLPEFLAEPAFPAATRPILFDPAGEERTSAFPRVETWQGLGEMILSEGD